MLYPFPACSASPPARVVVTGAGIVTALGWGWRANEEGFRRGVSAVRPITLFDASKQRAKVAAEAILSPAAPELGLSAHEYSRIDRGGRFLLGAAGEALEQSGWSGLGQLPIVIGTTSGGMSHGQALLRQLNRPESGARGQPTRILHYQAQRQGLDLLDAIGGSGPVTIIANACASGANAIGHAWECVRCGLSDRALAAGYDGLSHMVFCGFDSLQALSTTTCRPFAEDRDGLALGEGAAVLALETLEHARKRGAEILAEIVGYAATTDIHHLTQPHPDGDAALAAMTRACDLARVRPDQIDYLNAHGTGTPLNDLAEANAINRWAGEEVREVRVSSTKASVGHALGAAGAIEAVVCLMALRGRWLPAQPSHPRPDPACHFQVVRQPTEADVAFAVSNSFGFGGANATLVFRRWSKNEDRSPQRGPVSCPT